MTKPFSEARDEEAQDHFDRREKLFDLNDFSKEVIAVESHKLGADWARAYTLEELSPIVDALLFALQCNIIKHNGKVPGLTDEQVFQGSIEARDKAKDFFDKIKAGGD